MHTHSHLGSKRDFLSLRGKNAIEKVGVPLLIVIVILEVPLKCLLACLQNDMQLSIEVPPKEELL